MEFLVRTELTASLPADPEERSELLEAERTAGRHLLDRGVIAHIWRVPGRQANVAVMEAADATELHEVLTSLPLWPYTSVTVEALAIHPLSRS